MEFVVICIELFSYSPFCKVQIHIPSRKAKSSLFDTEIKMLHTDQPKRFGIAFCGGGGGGGIIMNLWHSMVKLIEPNKLNVETHSRAIN